MSLAFSNFNSGKLHGHQFLSRVFKTKNNPCPKHQSISGQPHEISDSTTPPNHGVKKPIFSVKSFKDSTFPPKDNHELQISDLQLFLSLFFLTKLFVIGDFQNSFTSRPQTFKTSIEIKISRSTCFPIWHSPLFNFKRTRGCNINFQSIPGMFYKYFTNISFFIKNIKQFLHKKKETEASTSQYIANAIFLQSSQRILRTSMSTLLPTRTATPPLPT